MKRKVTDKMASEFNKLYAEGLKMRDIAPLFDVTSATVGNYIIKSRAMTIEMIQKINKLYDEGFTMAMVADELGYSDRTICNYIHRPRPQGTRGING